MQAIGGAVQFLIHSLRKNSGSLRKNSGSGFILGWFSGVGFEVAIGPKLNLQYTYRNLKTNPKTDNAKTKKKL
jgi:hypothetical protein